MDENKQHFQQTKKNENYSSNLKKSYLVYREVSANNRMCQKWFA